MKTTHLAVIAVAANLFVSGIQAQPQPGSLRWSLTLPGQIATSPTVAPDGTIYVASGAWLYAVTNNGIVASNKWVFTNTFVATSPAFGSDSTIYLAANDGLYALGLDGAIKWKAGTETPLGPPAIAQDGTIYAFGSGYVFAFSPSGTLLWQTPVDETNSSVGGFSPAIGSDGTIYCGSSSFRGLTALCPDGELKWFTDTRIDTGETAAVARDGTLYITAHDFGLVAINTSGERLWTNGAGTYLFSGGIPVVGPDGTVYCSGFDGHGVHAISPAGLELWQYRGYPGSTDQPVLCPAIDAAGNIYHSTGAALVSLAPDGTTNWIAGNIYNRGSWVSPTIGPDGTIYAGVWNTLYAYYNTNKPADAPWPMYRQNHRHTGKVEKPSLSQPKTRADGAFQFQMYGQLGSSFKVQRTSDFTTWTSLTSFVATTVPVDVVDPAASNALVRFYRAVQQ